MLAQNIENSFFTIKAEMKEKEWELLKELYLTMKEKEKMRTMHLSDDELIYQGRAEAYLKIYERFFGVLRKNKDGSLDVTNLQCKVENILKELKNLLKA